MTFSTNAFLPLKSRKNKLAYSYVPNKRTGPNKGVGGIFNRVGLKSDFSFAAQIFTSRDFEGGNGSGAEKAKVSGGKNQGGKSTDSFVFSTVFLPPENFAY